MAKKTKHTSGAFCWAALGTGNAEDASRFYSELFGWTALNQVIHGTLSATFCQDGLPVCALFSMADELVKAGFPPNWVPYLSVSSADAAAALVDTAGGKMIEPPFDVPGAGRMAPFADAVDGKVAMWQPGAFIGAHVWGVDNTLAFMELFSTNIDVAASFYRKVFGWSAQRAGDHTRFSLEDEFVGTMRPVPSGSAASSGWRIHFQVADCQGMADKARSLGGTVREGPLDVPGTGRVAVIADRQNAEFAIVQPGG